MFALSWLAASVLVVTSVLAVPFSNETTSHLHSRAVSYPLHTSGRWILDASNKRVKLKCANWAGHMQVNIPEGLTHQTPQYIASWLANNGFNCVRLTYSIDLALNPNYSVQTSFKNAASSTGVSGVANLWNTAVAKNPWLSSSTTLGAFGTVISALNSAGVMVILDNHISKAGWCCSQTDGNGWFKTGNGDSNSQYFDVTNWQNGLQAMATFAKSYPNVIGMSLRNELRPTSSGTAIQQEWATRVKAAAQVIHSANSNLLIAIGGTSYALDLSWLYNTPLDTSAFANRVVWEFHWYSWSYSTTDCNTLKSNVGSKAGYLLTQGQAYTGPLWMSEFGIGLSGTITSADSTFLNCVVSYATSNDMEWAYWALQGSYYVRDSNADVDESFGLLKSDWSDWRNGQIKGLMSGMFQQTQGP